MTITHKQLARRLKTALKKDLIAFEDNLQELTLQVVPDSIQRILLFFRDAKDLNFRQLTDICGVDYPARLARFEVVYHLLSLSNNARVRIKIQIEDGQKVPTVTNIYSAANWYEREAWDMYGIEFDGHPDMRRLLTDYEFEGHPLRKDFPLTGYSEVRYDPEKQKVVYEPVNLPQAFRHFDALSPWEGMTPQLPGDEKAKE